MKSSSLFPLTCLAWACTSLVLPLLGAEKPPLVEKQSKAFFRARAEYLNGNLDAAEALTRWPAALAADPHLQPCWRAIQKARLQKATSEQKLAHWQRVTEVNHAWTTPHQVPMVFFEAPESPGLHEKLLSKLNTIVIPVLNFSGIPLNEVVTVLAELAEDHDSNETASPRQKGVNMVLIDPKNTNPSITLTLKNTTLKHALDFLTQSIHFLYDIEHDAVVLRPADSNLWGVETVVFPLSRGTVIRLTGNLQTKDLQRGTDKEKPDCQIHLEEKYIKRFLQKSGVQFDNITGSNMAFDGTDLIVTQTPRNLERIRNLLTRYQSLQQVEIEAKFLEVQEGVLEEVGFKWGVRRRNQRGTVELGVTNDNLRGLKDAYVTQGASGSDIVINSKELNLVDNEKKIPGGPPQIPNMINLGVASHPIAEFSRTAGYTFLQQLVQALEQHSGSDLMSAPKLTVLSGKTAHIVIAQELRYPEEFGTIRSEVGNQNNKGSGGGVTITAATPKNFKVRNVGVEMDVTPIVEHDRTISLQLAPTVTEFEGFMEYGGKSLALTDKTSVVVPSGFFQPIFSTRQIRTEVTILDGATVMMGGLTREETRKVNDKVPLLGNIPLLGRLFQSKGETTQKRNLLIFVTANLVSPAGTLYRE